MSPRAAVLSPSMLDAVAGQFRALSEPARLRLLQMLRGGPASVTDLAARTGLSHANASKHLLVLAGAGFVVRREEGTRTVYALADATTQTLCELMCDRVTRRAEADFRRLR